MRTVVQYITAAAIVLVAAATPVLAIAAAPAPEIDGGSITAGLGLLAAGVLIVRSRRRSK